MKRLCIGLTVLALLTGVASAATTYDWGHTGGLDSWLGYVVYLYDGQSTALPTTLNADLSTDTTFALVSGITDTITDNGKSGINYRDESFSVGAGQDVADNDYVLSIVFDTTGVITPGTTQWTYLNGVNGTPFQAPDDESAAEFTTTGNGNGWLTVVPEPGSVALFGIGLLTLAAGSRRFRRK